MVFNYQCPDDIGLLSNVTAITDLLWRRVADLIIYVPIFRLSRPYL